MTTTTPTPPPTDRSNGSRRIWTGIGAGILTVAVLGGVAAGAYRAGERNDDDRTVEVVGEISGSGEGDATRTIVVDGDRDWRGPGPGAFVFPLLVVGGIILLVSRRGSRRGWGPRPWDGGFDDWHRHAHAAAGAPLTPTVTTQPTPTPGPAEPPPAT